MKIRPERILLFITAISKDEKKSGKKKVEKKKVEK